MSSADLPKSADAAYEAIRSLNHSTISRTVPAPLAYDVLGSLQQVGFALDQLTRQLGAGLVRSLTTHDVYDDKGDPAASVALAVDALLLAGQHARRVGECLTTAQAAISGQGHPRVTSLEDLWAERLGVESGQTVDELRARFEHLSQFVLIGGIPSAGKAGAVSAEAATAYGDLWVLAGFLADARQLLTSEEGR